MADLSSCDVDPSNYGVLVKLADMGICANPAARRTKNFAGIRQLVPECLTFDANITEKVYTNLSIYMQLLFARSRIFIGSKVTLITSLV